MTQGPVAIDATPRQLMLTLLGAHAHPRERAVWSGGLVRLLGEFGFSPGTARVALTRLAARDLLARVPPSTGSGRHVHYTVTARGAAVLREGDSRIFSVGRAPSGDDRWTVLWHTIPDGRRLERARLTRRLRFLGFGPVHDRNWIAPHDHEDEVIVLLDELGVRDDVAMMVGRPAGALGLRPLIEKVWDVDDVAARYRAFVDEYAPYAAPSTHTDLDDRASLLLRTGLTHTFRQFAVLDPELPEALVPAPPHRDAAVGLFHDLYAALAPPAQRYFDKVITP